MDVSKIAHLFGGGGHVKAAGYTMVGTVDDVIINTASTNQGTINLSS